MSLSLEEAYNTMKTYERIENCPELIFTELFSNGISGLNLLYQIEINEQSLTERCQQIIQNLPLFQNCNVRNDGYHFSIFIVLENEKESIIDIDAYQKKYTFLNYKLNYYRKMENIEIPNTPEQEELSDFWKQFETFTINKRLSMAFRQLFPRGEVQRSPNIQRRLYNAIYVLFVKKSTIKKAYIRESNAVKKRNEWLNKQFMKSYIKQIEDQAKAPEMIKNIESKQKEVAEWLDGLGYTKIEKLTI